MKQKFLITAFFLSCFIFATANKQTEKPFVKYYFCTVNADNGLTAYYSSVVKGYYYQDGYDVPELVKLDIIKQFRNYLKIKKIATKFDVDVFGYDSANDAEIDRREKMADRSSENWNVIPLNSFTYIIPSEYKTPPSNW